MANLNLIKQLREATSCGIADCNKALAACGDNYEEAVDWLRKKGLSSAAKKSERVTTEGLIGIAIDGKKASIVEVNSETDFVARNDKFQELVKNIAKAGLGISNSENFAEKVKEKVINGTKIGDDLTSKIASIGENMQIRRGKTVELKGDGVISHYIHNTIAEGLGKIGVLLCLKSTADKSKLEEIGKQICMHIAASKPEFLKQSDVPAEKLQRERDVLIEQAKSSGKPMNIIEKMIEGRIRKFYEEICLLDQVFVMDNEKKVADVLKSFEKENGTPVEIQEYVLFILGAGLEKKENNFAEEVASMTK